MSKEASFTFTTPLTVNIVEIKGEEHLFVEGDISTSDIDLINDVMTKECQESMQKQIMERNMKLDLEHEAFKGDTYEEKEINKTKIPAGKLIDAMVKEVKREEGEIAYVTRVKGEINRNHKDYKTTKGNLLEKYLDAFSVAFLPIDVKYQTKDGRDITFDEYLTLPFPEKKRLLNDVILLNVALTGNPCNTKAQMTEIFTKSMDALEEYKKMKKVNPEIEKNLVVKSNEKKTSPISFVLDKIMVGEPLNSKEQKLLSAAMNVADNKGTQAQLAKEFMEKISKGEKLSWKELSLLYSLLEVENEAIMEESRSKSHSKNRITGKENSDKSEKLKKKTFTKKMAEDEDEQNSEEGSESDDVEQKSLSAVQEEMKSLSEKFAVVEKDNKELKDAVSEISKSVAKIVEALNKPIHKSAGVKKTDAETKAKSSDAEKKSADPMSVFS